MQYTFYKGEGLVTYQKLGHGTLGGGLEFLFRSFEVVMIVFALIHILLSIVLLFKWIGTDEYKNFISDPLRNSAIIRLMLMKVDIQLLKISFEKSFDVSKIHFGWLMHPFALGMITVTGTGLAAMAKNPSIAHTAAFMSMVSGTMGFFLLVVPNITLYALSAFRFGHYFHNHLGAHLHLKHGI